MIKIPVSSKIPTTPWPRSGVQEYTFSVRSSGGQPLGTDLKEFDWSLQVDSRRALVSVESFRSDADIADQPIGVFRFPIDDQQLREFQNLVTSSKLGELRPAMQGHPGYTERLYTFERPGQSIQQVINNSDEQTNVTIAPLRNKINSLLGTSFSHPERAVRLGIKQQPGGFEVTITNVGLEKVCFGDPRWLVAAGQLHRAVVMVTEFPNYNPGDLPALNWEPISLEAMRPYPQNEPLVELESQGVWRATVAWKHPAGKRYLAYFTWANYQGEPIVKQVYRIRGRADSPRLTIEP
jgi:hypothetical protein